MTLISNFITKDFIIIAVDRRLYDFNSKNQPILDKFRGDTKKLFPGMNYCIGMQGTFISNEGVYAGRFEQAVFDTSYLSMTQLLDIVSLIVHQVAVVNENVDEINLTAASFDEGSCFHEIVIS